MKLSPVDREDIIIIGAGLVGLASSIVINSAGLATDRIASLAGIDIGEAGYKIHLCKGEYFKVSNRHRRALQHLVYPAPTSVSIGAHADIALASGLQREWRSGRSG